MKFDEAKKQFIESWGTLGSNWGINKAMAQIHAVLLISPEPLNTDDIMNELGISRGNVSMGLRSLMEWGIVYKTFKTGDRKEYYHAEKDIWIMIKKIVKRRRENELEPVREMLQRLEQFKADVKQEEMREFKKVTDDIDKFIAKSDNIMTKITTADENWFMNKFIKLMS